MAGSRAAASGAAASAASAAGSDAPTMAAAACPQVLSGVAQLPEQYRGVLLDQVRPAAVNAG